MARPVNAAAIAIANFSEGCALRSYRDPAGVLTIGYGHTGPDVGAGMVITQVQANTWRAADMARAGAFVDAHVHVPLTDNQFSTLAEFTYNVGVGNFLGSTLLRVLNNGRYDLIPAQLARWNRAGGMVLPGLVTRRAHEAALFATPDTHSIAPMLTNQGHVPLPSPPLAAATPTAPSLLESIRAWFHRNAQAPA